MSRFGAAWPIARGSLGRGKVRWLLMAALLGLAIAAYLSYATFMAGANAGARLAVASPVLPADLVFLGARPLSAEALTDWRRHGGVTGMAEARLIDYHTAYGILRVFALPADSPLWPLVGVGSTPGSGSTVPLPGAGEILLPTGMLAETGLQSSQLTVIPPSAPAGRAFLTVVGAHAAVDSVFGQAGLVRAPANGPLPNCLFFWTTGQAATNSLAASLEVEYLQPTRPLVYRATGASVVHTGSADYLAAGILAQTYMPGFGIMTMVFIFSAIGLFTISSLSFLDRKRELAILKTVGLESRGVVELFSIEQGVVAAVGIGCGLVLGAYLVPRITAILPVATGISAATMLKAIVVGLLVQAAGVVMPALTARIATVNQLLYDMPIPLYSRRIYRSEV